MGGATIRVMVVDDHPVVLDGLAIIISGESDMEVVARASSAPDAVARFREMRPDVTLLDLRLGDKSGVEVITEVRREFPDARFIILTTYDGDENIFRAIQAGARGYVLKDVFRDEILATVRAVHAGKTWLPPGIAERLAHRLSAPALSPREVEILALIARGESNKGVAQELGITEGTVKAHLMRIFPKLGVDDRTAAVTVALARGILPPRTGG